MTIRLALSKSGLKLNIEALKLNYSVSYPSFREALSPLIGEGNVSFEELKGLRVLKSSQDALADSSRVRAGLEALAFAWAKRSAQEHTALKDAVLAADFVAAQTIPKKHVTRATRHAIDRVDLSFESLEKLS